MIHCNNELRKVLLPNSLDDNVIPVVEQLRRQLPAENDVRENATDDIDSFPQEDVETAEESENTFEFRALEVSLEAICSYLDARCTELENAGNPALDMLTFQMHHYWPGEMHCWLNKGVVSVRKYQSAMRFVFPRSGLTNHKGVFVSQMSKQSYNL